MIFEVGNRVIDPTLELRGEVVPSYAAHFGDRVMVKFDNGPQRWVLETDLMFEDTWDSLEADYGEDEETIVNDPFYVYGVA